MKPEKQRVVIAESYGWTHVGPRTCKKDPCGVEPGGTSRENTKHIPDYLNDRNHMIEAVKTLPRQGADTEDHFILELHLLTTGREIDYDTPVGDMFLMVTATPAQLAEAYLKTIKRWEDDNTCCANEDRDMNGGCRNCGDPCL